LKEFKTPARLAKIKAAVLRRQPSLHLVLENIHDQHNVGAIFRTCDASGVKAVSLVYNLEKYPSVGEVSSASANKWVERKRYLKIEDCYSELRLQGYKIYTSLLAPDAVSLYDLDLTEKVAIVVGNEHRGASPEAAALADRVFYIPMQGMIQSLNVSVATAVTLYESLRQRVAKGMYGKSEMTDAEIDEMIEKWSKK